MKLIYDEFAHVFEWSSDKIPVLIIKHRKVFNRLIVDFQEQSTDVLRWYHGERLVQDQALMIYSPFNINMNQPLINRRLARYLQNEFKKDPTWLSLIHEQLLDKLTDILLDASVALELSDELNLQALSKVIKVRPVIEYSRESLLDYLITSMNILVQLGVTNYFIFLDLKNYLSHEELTLFYQHCFLEEIQILLLESRSSQALRQEQHMIIDEDLCEIF